MLPKLVFLIFSEIVLRFEQVDSGSSEIISFSAVNQPAASSSYILIEDDDIEPVPLVAPQLMLNDKGEAFSAELLHV